MKVYRTYGKSTHQILMDYYKTQSEYDEVDEYSDKGVELKNLMNRQRAALRRRERERS
jgi:hypothetical protein